MPPPTASDPWLSSRRFGIVIDAGSSGSRLQIYSWKDPRSVSLKEHSELRHTLPKVETGARSGEEWSSKVEPGLSTFASDPEGVAAYLAPLLEHARNQVPPSLQRETPLFLLATAGMRLLSPSQQSEVLHSACQFLRLHSYFRVDDASAAGPCGSSVRIITGEEEGLFGWIAVNYLMDGFSGDSSNRTTYGFLDMGGASTQIAFEPSPAEREKSPGSLKDVRLRLLGGDEISHQVFVTTWLGYGTNQARERYVGQAINAYEETRATDAPHGSSTEGELVPDPCLPKDLRITESPVYEDSATAHNRKSHTLLGTGSFEQCLQKTAPLLNKHAPCLDAPCLFDGVHVPPIDFSVSHFIGISEYWYSSEHVFGLGGPYDFAQYERAASGFCSREWDSIVREHERTRKQATGHIGGDGEVEAGGQIVETGKWGDKVEISRLQMQCFKAAWVANVLHEGIGMPRIVDPGGNPGSNSGGGGDVAQHAEDKGLGRPVFQSVDTVGDIAISWTLGKMVLEASKEVPALPSTEGPLHDPLLDIPQPANSSAPVKHGRPPFHFGLEDHLPSSLTRESIGGVTVLGLIFYAFVLCAIAVVAYRVRHYARASIRRCVRVSRGSRDFGAEGYAMEEGKSYGAPGSSKGFLLPQRFMQRLRRLFSQPRRPRPTPLVMGPARYTRTSPAPPPRVSPTRSYSLPSQYANGGTGSSTQYSSRTSSPSPSFIDDATMSNSISSLTSMVGGRSRNTSQMNLSTLVPRQAPLSRANSALQVPNGSSFHDDSE
ncbi:hypothetical protein PLICRDRAFT_110398 [Plicaturopsis crispa FD-325 SS-3]|nr:hypothetical protein PLICRDRAFT_110398 [Plicaturopsis crispa FD-325 SS-3]